MIYFYNPHCSTFYGLNVFHKLTGRFNHNKYWYLTRYLLGRPREDVGVLVNLDQNSFGMLFTYKVRLLNRLVTLLEVAAWFALNRVNPFRFKVRFSASGLTAADVVVVFAYENLQQPRTLVPQLAAAPCVKVVHLTHYMLGTSLVSKHAEALGRVRFVAESDLSLYPYFKKFFPWYRGAVHHLPFIPQERFVMKAPYAGRELKCLAMGTLALLKRGPATADLMDFFGTDCVHPIRKAVYENRERIKEQVDCRVSLYNEDVKTKEISAGQSVLRKAYAAAWNLFKAKQKAYFSFSPVDLFNRYAMYVIPEEINNLPGISWAEGISCGCALVAPADRMYTDLGLEPGVHFIPYDNTLDGLLAAVEKYRRDPAALERVAKAGREFLLEKLSGERAAELFLADLRRLAAQAAAGVPGEKLEFRSSFVKEGA